MDPPMSPPRHDQHVLCFSSQGTDFLPTIAQLLKQCERQPKRSAALSLFLDQTASTLRHDVKAANIPGVASCDFLGLLGLGSSAESPASESLWDSFLPIERHIKRHGSFTASAHMISQIGLYLWWLADGDLNQEEVVSMKAEDDVDWQIGVSGFSSGFLAAAIVTYSRNLTDLISNGVQAVRLAFWIGLEAHKVQQEEDTEANLLCSWCLAVNGVDFRRIQELVKVFNETLDGNDGRPISQLYVSAVATPTCVTVNGPHSALQAFRQRLEKDDETNSTDKSTLFLDLFTPYHSRQLLTTAHETVIGHTVLHNIQFIFTPNPRVVLLSPVAGTEVTLVGSPSVSLGDGIVQTVCDSLLLEVCRWDEVCSSVVDMFASGPSSAMQITVFGPNVGFARQLREHVIASSGRMPADVVLDRVTARMAGAPQQQRNAEEKIAIVGLGCRLPGKVEEPEELWELLKEGGCTMEEVPPSRFDVNDYCSETGEERNKMRARYGHFLCEPGAFDANYFNMSPREALNTDPQQRNLLETAVKALDDAGYQPDKGAWQRTRIGSFVGVATDDYHQNIAQNIDSYYCPGTIRGFAAGRLSHFFKWEGPSLTLDTACSSSMVAVHEACQALRTNECDAALAGGVSIISAPEMFIGLSKGYFISNTGGSKTFDETADGYCRAEGFGVVALKRLSDAIRDEDRIHATIIASGTNQSGTSESITHPHAPTQAKLFKQNCEQAGIDPLFIKVVEAHGTGTQAGDVNEMASIQEAYCRARPSSDPLYVGALKPNIGHSEAASGISSLLKAVLMLKHKQVVPHKGVITHLNTKFRSLEETSIKIPTTVEDFVPAKGCDRRIISVNNFGAPGGNANVVVEEYLEHRREQDVSPRTHHVVLLSAKSDVALITTAQKLAQSPGLATMSLADLSYTTTARRARHPVRIALSYSSHDELHTKLLGKLTPVASKPDKPRVGFMCSGHGSQYTGMGKSLMESCPTFRRLLQHCDTVCRAYHKPGMIGVIEGAINTTDTRASAVISTHAAMFSVGYALGKMWEQWGVKPAALVGHSLGEYTVACLAGIISLENALKLVVRRAELLLKHFEPNHDGILAAIVPKAQARKHLFHSGCQDVSVACFNAAEQVCFAGPRSELNQLSAYFNRIRPPISCKLLESPFAFHTPRMQAVSKELREVVANIPFESTSCLIGLNLTGGAAPAGQPMDAEYFPRQLESPVEFNKMFTEVGPEADVWLDLSASPVCLGLAKEVLSSAHLLPTLERNVDCWKSITRTLVQLEHGGVELDWGAYHRGQQVKLLSLPSYPFCHSNFWIPYRDRDLMNRSVDASTHQSWNTELGPAEQIAEDTFVLDCTNPAFANLVKGHAVGGVGIAPASFYVYLALELASGIIVRNLEILRPLVAQKHDQRFLRVCIRSPPDSVKECQFYASSTKGDEGTLVAHCRTLRDDKLKAFEGRLPTVDYADKISKPLFYRIFSSAAEYGWEFQAVECVHLQNEGKRGSVLADVNVRPMARKGRQSVGPIALDTWMQPAGFAMNLFSSDKLFIVGSINEIHLPGDPISAAEKQGEQEKSLHRVGVDFSWTNEQKNEGKADICVFNSTGRRVASIKGMRFQGVKRASWRANVAGLSGAIRASPPIRPSSSSLEAAKPTSQPTSQPAEESPYSFSLVTSSPTSSPLSSYNSKSGDDINADDDDNGQVPRHSVVSSSQEPPPQKPSSGFDPGEARATFRKAIVEQLGVSADAVHDDASLSGLGVDSIMSLNLQSEFNRLVGHKFPRFDLNGDSTVDDVLSQALAFCEKVQGGGGSSDSGHKRKFALELESADASFTPTVASTVASERTDDLVHGQESTMVFILPDALGNFGFLERFSSSSIETVLMRWPDTFKVYDTLPELAIDMRTRILSLACGRPFILAGHSFGGLVAYQVAREIARVLEYKEYGPLCGLVIIDSPYPQAHQPVNEAIFERLIGRTLFTSRIGKELRLARTLVADYSDMKYHCNRTAVNLPVTLLSADSVPPKELLRGDEDKRRFDASCCGSDWDTNRWKAPFGGRLRVHQLEGHHFDLLDAKRERTNAPRVEEALRELIERSKGCRRE